MARFGIVLIRERKKTLSVCFGPRNGRMAFSARLGAAAARERDLLAIAASVPSLEAASGRDGDVLCPLGAGVLMPAVRTDPGAVWVDYGLGTFVRVPLCDVERVCRTLASQAGAAAAELANKAALFDALTDLEKG
jgi:hypothetical protein